MNSFWERASRKGVLESVFSVLKTELEEESKRKKEETAKFDALEGKAAETVQFQKDSGLTRDVCCRIYSEVSNDIAFANGQSNDERIAVYGERALGTLFSEAGKRKWDTKCGCSPTDIIIVRSDDTSALMGDCKFGLKSENAWIFRNKDQYEKEFGRKFSSVAGFLKEYDDFDASPYMLLIVTSSMAPLLVNRFSDFKLDARYADMPYDKIVICSVKDIMAKVAEYAT